VHSLREEAQTRNHSVLVDSKLKPAGFAILTDASGLGVEQSDAS
jgi:hypothetical protein